MRADTFKQTRLHHAREAAEDYTELVHDLIEEQGEARVKDLASLMGVSHVTVLKTLKRLEKEGYVLLEKKAPIRLTDQGKKLAEFCKNRHLTLLTFLQRLGVSDQTAEIDVEGIEHHISSETLEKIEEFMG